MEEEYQAIVQSAYVAYYGRPADPGGLAYWVTRLTEAGGDLSEVIADFGNSVEFTERYGALSNTDLVNGIYQQLFNRSAEPEGLAYYVDLLVNGVKTLQTITLDILFGAQNEDIVIVNNKVEFAKFFTDQVTLGSITYSGSDDANSAKSILAFVTSLTTTDNFLSILDDYAATGGDSGDLLLPEQYADLLSIVELNDNTGILSTEALRAAIVAITGQGDYDAAFNVDNYPGASDGVFTAAELGFGSLGDLPATGATLESLLYGTMINAMKSIDASEIEELTAFAIAHQDMTGTEQAYIDLLIGIFQDAAIPPLYDDATIAQIVVTGGAAFVEVVATGAGVSIFDGLFGLV